MSNSDIAREVASLIATHESEVSEGWHWRKGTVLFPEAKCPFCSSVIKSRAVWLVEDFYLRGQGVPVAGRELKLDAPSHPHATPSAICMGDAVDPLQALFNGLNPKSSWLDTEHESHGGIPKWLRGPYWEHDCSEGREAEESEDEDDEYEYYCESCGEGLSEDDYYSFNDFIYCENCFSHLAFYCHGCDDTYSRGSVHEGGDEHNYCYDCFSEKWFVCDSCDKTCSQDDHMRDGECSNCYEYPNSCAASDCGIGFDLDDGGGTCSECAKEFCEGCLTSHSDCPPEPVTPTTRRRRRT